ncbi:MAG: 50S ribosomal protein L35 [Neisseriaceae bacterium]
MPKLKTKSSAKKRFKILGNGKIKRPRACKRHMLIKKANRTKRQLRGSVLVHASDCASVCQMLPNAG